MECFSATSETLDVFHCTMVSVISGAWAKMISKNVSKHEITVSLYSAKLNMMKDIVSMALADNNISHKERLLIKSEVDKYNEMKKSIRQKYQSVKIEVHKGPTQEDMKRIEKEIRKEIMKKLLNQGDKDVCL